MWGKLPTIEDRVSKPRAQRDDHFQTASGDHTGSGNFGVIENLGRNAKSTLNRLPHIKVIPLLNELGKNTRARPILRDVVRGCNHNPVTNHSRHPNGHAMSFRKLRCKVDDRLNQQFRRKRVGSGRPFRRSNHCPLTIKDGSFNSATAAIHCQCHLASHSYRLQPPMAFILKRQEI